MELPTYQAEAPGGEGPGSYLLKLTELFGIPVGVLKAGRSFSPSWMALIPNTWNAGAKGIVILGWVGHLQSASQRALGSCDYMALGSCDYMALDASHFCLNLFLCKMRPVQPSSRGAGRHGLWAKGHRVPGQWPVAIPVQGEHWECE